MKQNEKMAQANALGSATTILEHLNTRLAVGGRGWEQKQYVDWCALRLICNTQIAKAELLQQEPDGATAQMPLKAVQ